jgi:hypothetical protein
MAMSRALVDNSSMNTGSARRRWRYGNYSVANHPGYRDVVIDQARLNAITDSEDLSAQLLEHLEGEEPSRMLLMIPTTKMLYHPRLPLYLISTPTRASLLIFIMTYSVAMRGTRSLPDSIPMLFLISRWVQFAIPRLRGTTKHNLSSVSLFRLCFLGAKLSLSRLAWGVEREIQRRQGDR